MFLTARRWQLAVLAALTFAGAASGQIVTTPTTFAGMTTVGTTSQPVLIALTAGSSGTLTAVVALTGGSPNLDFKATPLTCTVNAYLNAGDVCQISVVFAPRFPGVRQGAVVLQAGSQPLATALLSGVARGSLPVLVPGTINTVAGDAEWIYQHDGAAATQSSIFLPSGVAVDAAGNLFICDSSNNRVRRVDALSGLISTVAGDGYPGVAGDGGQATAAQLNNPSGIAIDGAGNFYIADSGNNLIRFVNTASGVIMTFAGQADVAGYSGDGGPATSALLTTPRGLAFMPGGDLLITDSGNHAVRLVNILSNTIQTIAGTGLAGFNGDGIAATSARLNSPYGVAVRSDGAVAIADLENQRVRLVNTAGVISTVAGTGQRSFAGDGAQATQAELNGPADVAFDPAGDLFIADSGNNRVRIVAGDTATIQTVIGNSSEQFTGDGGAANLASLYGPYGLFFDPSGNIWLSDTFHNRIREVNASMLTLTYPTMKVGNISAPMVEMLSNEGDTDLLLSTPVLSQAALDPGTTTCDLAAMAPFATCSMGVEFAPTQVGSLVTGSISWPSNAPHLTPIDILNGHVLSVNVTTIALTSSLNPGLLGQSVTLTATVVSADTGRTGTVTFAEGSNTWCAAVPLTNSGTASCTVPGLSLGSHTFTASYSGNANNAPSLSPPFIEIIKQRPALAFSVSPNPAVVISNVTLTLSAVDQSGIPAGSIIFYDGATALVTVALDNSGNARWNTQTLGVGIHHLSAQYAGDSGNIGATSSTINEQITQAPTATAVIANLSNAPVGAAITFNATVTNGGATVLTGFVTFKDATTVLASSPLAANGMATITASALIAGIHSITATYSGDTNDAPSSSPPLTETIQPIATVTLLSSDANPLNAGAILRLAANIAPAPGATADGAITGTITFFDGPSVLATAALGISGQATVAVNALAVGPHPLLAHFNGNPNYAGSTSTVLSENVQTTATQTVLTSVSSATLMGKDAAFTATVTSATGVPGGLCTLRDGLVIVGTATLNASGDASFSIATLTHGAHSMTAAYSGDANYRTSTSAPWQQLVQLAQPAVTLSSPVNAVDAGTAAHFTATLTTPGVEPMGTLTLLDGISPTSAQSVSGLANFSFSVSTLSIGAHVLTASYSGDANNSAAVSSAVAILIEQAGSATTLASSANPLMLGGTATLTATVVSDSPNLGGRVNFLDSFTLMGSAVLQSNGIAIFTPGSLGAGSHALTAVYVGDTNHAGSTSAPLTELVVQSTSATLTSNNDPSANGQNVTFTMLVKGAGPFTPSGTASLRDNGALLAAVSLNDGSGSFTTSLLTVGPHTLELDYPGDRNFSAAGAQLLQTVVDATTQMTLTASVNPARFGQPVALTATIVSNGGMATGAVTFIDSAAANAAVNIGSAPLNASGAAVLTASRLTPGTHTIVAEYAGDGRAGPSASAPVTLVVKQTTALTITSSSNPALTLSAISFTAGVANAGAATATSAVSFTESGAALGSATLDGTGHATLTLPGMTAGSHAIAASYAGDGANFASDPAVLTEAVQLRPTVTTLAGSATGPMSPRQVTLIAVVEGQGPGPVPPGGIVTFTSGGSTLGQTTVGVTGVGTLTVVFAEATESIVASYAGDASYAASQSSANSITAGTPAAFTLSVSAPSITVVSSQHATINVALGSVKGFTDTIQLGCLGLPEAGTCTFTPSTVALPPNGIVTASLFIDTGNPLGAGSGTTAALTPGAGTLLCCLPLGLFAGLLCRRRGSNALRSMGLVLAVLSTIPLALGLSACSGLKTSATTPGTYTFKVVGTGQSSGITETQTITLVVAR